MIRRILAGTSAAAVLSACAYPPAALAQTGARSPKPDPVLEWNAVALRTTAAAPFNPPLESRSMAIVHAAMFDAVNSIVGEFQPYAVDLHARDGSSPEAAAVAAAHLVLVRLYPDQNAALDAMYAVSIEGIPGGRGKAGGLAVGESVASRVLALRAGDGAEAAVAAPFTPGAAPGDWTPTPPAFRPALDPGWGSVKPFCMESGSQFRPGPPPARDGGTYARDYEEIKGVGSDASPTRTQAETDLARFWIATAAQNWNPVARLVAAAQRQTLSQNARAFALLNLAGADAFIAAWDAKFAYAQWRPVTAIRAAGRVGSPGSADPTWTPLLVTPPFPDYIAGHTAYAGAAEEALNHVFGRHPGVALTLTSATAPGVALTYGTFDEIADGVVEARILGGIHWRTSSERGRIVGERVGRYVGEHCLKPMHRERE